LPGHIEQTIEGLGGGFVRSPLPELRRLSPVMRDALDRSLLATTRRLASGDWSM